jgi:[ribosomal protein S18]-alanine N-acetyltransferase
MKHKIKITLAKRKDRHDIQEINKASIPETFDPEYIETHIAYKNSFILKDNSLTIGYILCNDKGHIVSFVVLEKYRGNGYGRELLEACIENLEDKQLLHASLNVRVTNTKAIKLYESVGFIKEKVLDKYYLDSTDAYYMKKLFDDR